MSAFLWCLVGVCIGSAAMAGCTYGFLRSIERDMDDIVRNGRESSDVAIAATGQLAAVLRVVSAAAADTTDDDVMSLVCAINDVLEEMEVPDAR